MSTGFNLKSPPELASNKRVSLSFKVLKPSIDFSSLAMSTDPWWLSANLLVIQETWVQPLGWEDPLEKGMATHSSVLAREIPWSLVDYSPWGCKELDTMDVSLSELRELVMESCCDSWSRRVGHDWATELNWATNIFTFSSWHLLPI